MIDFISSILLKYPYPFKVFQWILILIFTISIFESICCIMAALKFNVEELVGYHVWFSMHYKIASKRDNLSREERNNLSWEDSKQNWFLWAGVFIGNLGLRYSSLLPYQHIFSSDTIKNIVFVAGNLFRYCVLVLLVPFYLILSILSIFERFARYLLTSLVFFVFWFLAKIKILFIYHFTGSTFVIDSKEENAPCIIDVLYRKPVIRVILHTPQKCPDPSQKDILNNFTNSLKSKLPPLRKIKFKTEVFYPRSVNMLQADLPLTYNYLHSAYSKLNHIQSNKGDL